MTYIQNLFTSRDNNAQGNTYVGQEGRIWWDPDRNALYYSDGNTAGGIPIGSGGSGPGVPGGPTNSIQYNLGGGNFGGNANLVITGAGLSASGNITAAWFIGNVSTTGNVTGGNILTNNYLYANGASIFANTVFTGNIDLGNLYIDDQTIGGKNLNANIILLPEGSGWVTVPKLVLGGMTIANTGTAVDFITPANVNIQFDPGANANILTAGTIKPTSNNLAGLGAADSRYTDLWLGSGNINLIDQTLNQNQQIYADNGNLILANADGIKFGDFEIYGNTIATTNPAANILIGLVTDSAYVEINRALTVNSTGGSGIAFQVEQDGTTQINVPAGIPANTAGALNIVASTDGGYQNVTNSGGMVHLTGPANSASRITVDAFGTQGGSGATSALVLRAARGTASTPTATQANDILGRVSALGWGTTFGPSAGGLAPTAMEFVALENFTDTAQGSKITFNTAEVGANSRSVSATIQANGVSFLNNTIANSGITFRDGTFQNTAYLATNTVGSATAATGISIAPTSTSATGNITITNTGVITTAGTANQVFVGSGNAISPANGAVQLSLPQDIAPTSNVQFYSLTVTDLSITGNVSNVIPSVVSGKIVYVANTATGYGDINDSGLVTGNAANGAWAGMLYDTSGAYANTWNFAIGNSIGIYAGNVYGESGQFIDQVHVGFGNATVDFPDASIQADCDIDSYNQVVLMNHNQGANASADFVAVANNGDDSNFYIDMGINSNVYNNADYAAFGSNDGYLYVNGGNLIIATQTAAKVIKFVTGGTNSTSLIRGTVNDTGLSMVGNVTANNFIGNALTITGIISAGGNIISGSWLNSATGVSTAGNVVSQAINTGIVSASGNITGGNLRIAGTISAAGNIVTAGYIITPTSAINSGISTSGNITGANIFAAGTISATGNIDGSNIIANLAVISSTLSILGNIQGGNLLTAGIISTSGNATFGNVQTTGRVSVTGNIDSGNIRTTGIVTATGNVSTAGFFVGDGGFISNISVATGTKIVNGTSWANLATSGGNLDIVISSASVGTFTSTGANVTGYATVSGNITGGNLIGQNLTAGRVAIVGAGKQVSDDPDFTYNSTTNVLSVAGNVNAAYFNGNVVGNGSMLTGVITTILPSALSDTVHIAANTVGNTATIITDATTANVANTIVVRDSTGGINVSNWSINARTVAANTTATTTDYWIGLTAKNLVVTLPNAANGAVQGRQYLIVDCVQSGAPGDTIATEAGATVVGGSLSQQGQSKTCVFIAATNTWYCN